MCPENAGCSRQPAAILNPGHNNSPIFVHKHIRGGHKKVINKIGGGGALKNV